MHFLHLFISHDFFYFILLCHCKSFHFSELYLFLSFFSCCVLKFYFQHSNFFFFPIFFSLKVFVFRRMFRVRVNIATVGEILSGCLLFYLIIFLHNVIFYYIILHYMILYDFILFFTMLYILYYTMVGYLMFYLILPYQIILNSANHI